MHIKRLVRRIFEATTACTLKNKAWEDISSHWHVIFAAANSLFFGFRGTVWEFLHGRNGTERSRVRDVKKNGDEHVTFKKVVPSSKLTWQWKFTFSNRKYIFKWWIFRYYVSLPEGNGQIGTLWEFSLEWPTLQDCLSWNPQKSIGVLGFVVAENIWNFRIPVWVLCNLMHMIWAVHSHEQMAMDDHFPTINAE